MRGLRTGPMHVVTREGNPKQSSRKNSMGLFF